MPVHEAGTPTNDCYRIGYAPEPLHFPPWDRVGGERFDDPLGEFRVLYTAEQRRACFLECLAPLRPDPDVLARLRAMPSGDPPDDLPGAGIVSATWRLRRMLGRLALVDGQRWLDLTSLAAREAIRRELAPLLRAHGYHDFDVSIALRQDRALTQQIARWAYVAGFRGLAYPCRFDASLTNWAIFEGAFFVPVEVEWIAADDPDLVAVARDFNLTIRP